MRTPAPTAAELLVARAAALGLLTTAQAAAAVGHPPGTVSYWHSTGRLGAADWYGRHPLFRAADVRACAARGWRLIPLETDEDVAALVAERMKDLPPWWHEDEPKGASR